MSDIFREVDDALQQDKLLKIWEEYKTTIVAAIIILIASTAITTAYKSWDAGRDATETARLMNAMEADNPAAALKEVIGDTRGGHEAIALMTSAALLVEEDKQAEAAALYQQAAEDKNIPKDYRDLSRVLYNQHAEKPSIEILQPLLANDKSPWIWHARLQAAVISGEDQKNMAQALDYLKLFDVTESIPLSLKQRAKALQHVYALQQKENSETNKTEETK